MDINILNWNWNEKTAAGRHVLNTGATILATLAAVHFISPQDASSITDNLNTVWDGIVKVGTGVAGLIAALTPIYTALTAKKSAEPASQIKNVVTNLSAPQATQVINAIADPEGRNKLISAVSKMDEVRGIVMPESVARTIDSTKVVGSPAEVQLLPPATPRAA